MEFLDFAWNITDEVLSGLWRQWVNFHRYSTVQPGAGRGGGDVHKWATLHMGHSSEAWLSVLPSSLEGCTLLSLPFWSLLVQALYPGECLESIKVGEAPVSQGILAISTLLVNLEVWSDGESNPWTCLFFEIIHQPWVLAHRWIPNRSLCLWLCDVYLLLPRHFYVLETCGDKVDV